MKPLLFVFSLLLLLSCEKEPDKKIIFAGDSLIARWDVAYYFPGRQVLNYGVSGSGIDDLRHENINGRGADVVILIGTNDLGYVDENHCEEYIDKYMETLMSVPADHVYLISLLPRGFKGDLPGINDKIKHLNARLANKADQNGMTYIDVYNLFVKGGTLNQDLSYDGLHLNDHGYQILAGEVKKYIK